MKYEGLGINERQVQIQYPKCGTKSFIKKVRVAGYCRVSTESDDQMGSLENQINAFQHLLTTHDDWELIDVYSDEVSGTNTKKRPGFQRMIRDCEIGKIDYIITKSLSRFARNTIDCLKYVRELREMGINLYFIKEGIDTADSYSEMLLTVMAAFAQEESRSISENVKWSMRKQFEAGKELPIPLYGYHHAEDDMYQIVPEQAAVVQEIFYRFVHGELPTEIMNDLVSRDVPPPHGSKWRIEHLNRMLRNEKYVGDVTLQKNYIVDHLSHRMTKNTGQLPMYHIENAHRAIIDRKTFRQTTEILKLRHVSHGNSRYPYGDMLMCPLCGETMVHGSLNSMYFGGRKIRHNGGWGCYGENGCRGYLLIQDLLDAVMLEAYHQRYRETKKQVDFYWLDDCVRKIELKKKNEVVIYWKDNTKLRLPLPIDHEQLMPENAAEQYRMYLDKAATKKKKNKYMMGGNNDGGEDNGNKKDSSFDSQ